METPSVAVQADSGPRIPLSRKRNRTSFWFIHLACLGALWTGASPAALWVCAALYLARMFAITGWYHRYFSHRAFTASRPVQFAFAFLGCSAAQKGPLWWASHHREHHRVSDKPEDLHSPLQYGFWRAHILWFLDPNSHAIREERIKDFLVFPELRWLERYHWTAAAALLAGLFVLGFGLDRLWPGLGTGGLQMVVWGFFISTVLVYHGTFLVNSLGHMVGRQRYDTGDQSRNSGMIALLTLGEGWHNNHHRYPVSARQGFFWWEFDPTYYGLKALSWLGIIHNLKPVPERVKRGADRPVTQPAPIPPGNGMDPELVPA